MANVRLVAAAGLIVLLPASWCVSAEPRNDEDNAPDQPLARREFRFEYQVVVTDLPATAKVRVWLPVAQSNDDQDVKLAALRLPVEGTFHDEPVYDNRILYLESRGRARLPIKVAYHVQRREVRGLKQSATDPLPLRTRNRFLSANRKVPITGRPLRLLAGLPLKSTKLDVARQLYFKVDDHMRYDKSKPGYGTGDSVWACDSRFGNCTDFHSLFISLARSQGLPSRFEIGFPLPVEKGAGTVGGYHCWASFFHGPLGWVPVDISEADKNPKLKGYYFGNLTADRVAFSTGRDIQLVPRQAGPPLNYFVYPYVEVDGKPWPEEQVELRFSYRDRTKK